MARLTGFEPVTIRLEGGCSIQLSYKRVTDANIICLEELVGAVGFEPTTPWSQTRCTTRLCYAPIHLSFRIEHRSEEHTSELQSREKIVCRLLLEKKKR